MVSWRIVALAVVAPLALAACGGANKTAPAPWITLPVAASPSVSAGPAIPVSLRLTPVRGKKDVPISAEIGRASCRERV